MFVVVSVSSSDTPEEAVDVDVAGVDGCGADGDNAGITAGLFEPPVDLVASPALGWIAKSTILPESVIHRKVHLVDALFLCLGGTRMISVFLCCSQHLGIGMIFWDHSR
ncbi:hypothetical protein BYT27DRAFT_7246521 [Phlegmacium glaucopus]|nr:hypothetical protein BYT27DRAFT_7246521 [Phlegmacium glaucopus]